MPAVAALVGIQCRQSAGKQPRLWRGFSGVHPAACRALCHFHLPRPTLIVLQDETVKRALVLSRQAFARNIGGAGLCLILLTLAAAAAALPLGLGFLLLMPMALLLPYIVCDVFFGNQP